jgi:hypothetical protein
MYIVYRLDNGELTYTADAEATQYLDADTYGWVEITIDNWTETHCWDPVNRSLEPLPPEEG